MNFNLGQLRAFARVARLASFTRAAEELHVSQPALTVRIRELEAALGLKLLDRNTRRVQPTAVGRELLPVFERVLGDISAVAQNARELASGHRGIVHVAALPSVCAMLLPEAIARLRESHPGIVLRLTDTVAQRIFALVRSEEVDLGVGHFPRRDPEIELEALLDDRLVLVLPAGHPLAAKRRLALEDLQEHSLVCMDTQSSVRALVERAFAERGLRVVPAFEVTYMSSAIGLVRAGLGVTLLPSSAVELEAPGLETRAIASPALRREIAIARKAARSLSPAARTFLAALQECARRPAATRKRPRPRPRSA